MKKMIIKAGSIAFFITTIMGIVNYVLGVMMDKIIGIEFSGGEVLITYGFGIRLQKTYAEYSVYNPIESKITVDIAPVNYVLTVVVLGIVIYFISFIFNKCKKRV